MWHLYCKAGGCWDHCLTSCDSRSTSHSHAVPSRARTLISCSTWTLSHNTALNWFLFFTSMVPWHFLEPGTRMTTTCLNILIWTHTPALSFSNPPTDRTQSKTNFWISEKPMTRAIVWKLSKIKSNKKVHFHIPILVPNLWSWRIHMLP